MVVCPSPHRPHPYIPSPFLHVSPPPPASPLYTCLPHYGCLSVSCYLSLSPPPLSTYVSKHLSIHIYRHVYVYINLLSLPVSLSPLLTFICIHLRVIVINIAYALHPHITPNLDRATVQSVYTLSYLFFPSYLASIISHASVPVTICRLSAVALPCSLVSLCSPLAPLLVNRRGGVWNLILASMA